MNKIKKLLIIPCIAPLLFIILVALVNTGPKSKIRFLIWETENIRLSSLITISAISGFTIGTFLTFQVSTNSVIQRRKVVINKNLGAEYEQVTETSQEEVNENKQVKEVLYHERDLRQPKPTIQVTYKVIKKKPKSSEYIDTRKSNIQNNAVNKYNVTENADDIDDDWNKSYSDIWE